ncbi:MULTISPECIES: ABC transporter permease subunit [Clostridium]|uniref:Sugar ABC transporter permease n=1 Tax=Clostridium cibarium TaxID=2762247 RepID=A0ABR8PRF9_9CLOT|nr:MULTISPECIES: ABC transporter permease subunit [Clostridium]MBD7910760.1 sugar ABC transporter permease [Clostridium cibarium]
MENSVISAEPNKAKITPKKKISLLDHIKHNKWLYIMLIPGIIYFIVFRFAPMWGLSIAFKDYSPYLGFSGSKWVGFEYFKDFFSSPDFGRLMSNTLILGALNVTVGFAFPIILALLLNELRVEIYKKCIQTAIYVPHFVSWTIVASISVILLTADTGALSNLLETITGHQINALTEPGLFKPMIVFQGIWKESGYGTIIYLAALASVDPEQYEAAVMDGAGRFKRVIHITLPAIKNTIVVMLILKCGQFLSTGFDQIFLMTNSLNRVAADVFDTYVYQLGITQGAYSYATAVGLFKSLVGVILVLGSNFIAKKVDPDSGIF